MYLVTDTYVSIHRGTIHTIMHYYAVTKARAMPSLSGGL